MIQENGILPHLPNSEIPKPHLSSAAQRLSVGTKLPEVSQQPHKQPGFDKRRRNTLGDTEKGMRSIDADSVAFSQK